ncbi:hypothetical protein [Coleofasciculus sp.]|uniref:hypothetical protein n=1 Tax=Coleofasciculus sp. TaxID=3100458 RepID=UPI003A34AA15
MNISDLNYLEQMNQGNDLVGGYYGGYGGDDFDVTTIQEQVSDLNQYASSDAEATAQYGGALADSAAVNTASVSQILA